MLAHVFKPLLKRTGYLLLVNGYWLFAIFGLALGLLVDAAKLTNREIFNLTPNDKSPITNNK